MMERQVVLFGGSGFVGRHLAPRLAADGWVVWVASRHPRQEAASAAAGVRAVTADLGDEDQVRRAMLGAEAVITEPASKLRDKPSPSASLLPSRTAQVSHSV
jgi:uncharacterized protein YbjT (DUF2867 family)